MPYFKDKYLTDSEVQQISESLSLDDREAFRSQLKSSSGGGDFLMSAAVGAVTGSSIIGAIAGGSIVGGIVGDLLEGSDDSFF